MPPERLICALEALPESDPTCDAQRDRAYLSLGAGAVHAAQRS